MQKTIAQIVSCLAIVLFCKVSCGAQILFQDQMTKKYGFRNTSGQVLVPAEYDKLSATFDTLMIPEKNGMKGVINNRGEVIIPFEYRSLRLSIKPAGHQHGFAIVSKDKSSYGILDAKGQLVLPLQFDEYTQALAPDLLVGHVRNDEMLQFFDAHGKLLFKAPGRRAFPGFNDETVQIESKDYKLYFIFKKDGSPVFPSNLPFGKWTDGNLIVYGQYPPFGIINFAGDTILPFEYESIRPSLPGQFLVKMKGFREGIVDGNGKFVIPVDTQDIKLWENVYQVNQRGISALYNANGQQILPFEYDIWDAGDVKRGIDIPERNIYKHVKVRNVNTNKWGLYATETGACVLPVEYSNIHYFSDLHPLITLKPGGKENTYLTEAFDITGKALLPRPMASLQRTPDPRVLIGVLEPGGPSGFIKLDGVLNEKSFVYRDLLQSEEGYYTGRQEMLGVVLSAEGKVLYQGEYATLSAPKEVEITLFEKKNNLGKLVAELQTPETAPDAWIGVSSDGKLFYFQTAQSNPTALSANAKLPSNKPAVSEWKEENDWKVWKYEEISGKPEYPGGEDEMDAFFKNNLQTLPGIEKVEPAKKTVRLRCVVEKDGSLTDIRGDYGNNRALEQEAIRVVKLMPKWLPGRAGKRPVRCATGITVDFK